MTTRSSIAVLTVARWYPSHDSPGRGSFVADLVDATRAHGVDHVVASFELLRVAPLGGDSHFVDELVADAAAALRPPDDPAAALARPLHWGARGVPVARLAVPRPPAADGPAMLELHDAAFGPWADRLVATWRPDLIHAHTGIPDGIVAARLGRRYAIPVLVTEHASTIERELEPPTTRAQYVELAGRADVVAVSRSLAGRLQRALGLEHEIDVLPNAVDEASFPASRDRRRSNELLWVGAMAPHKGTDALLRAFALARAERPDLTLRVIGRPASGTDDVYRDLAADLGVGDAVAFDGWADRPTVAEAMRRATVFVHPSPSETFGVVAAEAILSGLPVATAPSGGVPEILETAGGFGAVARVPSPEALAAAIAAVLDRRDVLDPDAARARIVETYGRAAVAQRVRGRYEQLVGPDGPGRSVSRRAPASRPPLTSPVVVATSPGWLSASLAPAPDGFRQGLTVVAPVGGDDEGDRGAQRS
ncbi:MAG: glycosyltransferase, partial [Chloroflexota bacterium]